jgi:hypothetical protein
MAYTTTNPPRLLNTGVDSGPNVWLYSSADAQATVVAAGYITNAKDLGMKVNDLVFIVDTATPKISSAQLTVLNATTGASTMSTGVQLS